ncbi:hypothetical protein N7G274_010115 [Stereocaulon virgatum]|uniref:Uncharacterized protein n=1 Tax=Stereocaulon virgatum TaxID=373712 RepID=A0ABR3ZVC6_9LECA
MHLLYGRGPNLVARHSHGNNTLKPIRVIDYLQQPPIEAYDDMANLQLIEIKSRSSTLDYGLHDGTQPEDCCLAQDFITPLMLDKFIHGFDGYEVHILRVRRRLNIENNGLNSVRLSSEGHYEYGTVVLSIRPAVSCAICCWGMSI